MKCFLFLAVLLCIGSVAGAQKIDSLYADTIHNPNTIFMRVKLPDTGYALTTAYVQDYLIIPQQLSSHFYFTPCKGNPHIYFDTLIDLFGTYPYTFWITLGEDVSTDPHCESRPELTVTDTATLHFYNDPYWAHLGVPAIPKKPRVSSYPNPAKSIVNLVDVSGGLANASISNYQGQLIYQSKISGSIASIDLKEYPPGIYLLRVKTTDGKVYTEKLIVNR